MSNNAALYAPRRKRFTVLVRFRYGAKLYEAGELVDPAIDSIDMWYLDKQWRKGHLEVFEDTKQEEVGTKEEE